MRINGNILLNLGLGLAVVFCLTLTAILGLDLQRVQPAPQPEQAFQAYADTSSDPSDAPLADLAQPAPGQTPKTTKTTQPEKPKTRTLKPAVLQVVTNFDKADVTVNGLVYPEYVEPGEPEGMVLPAGGPYDVRVTYSGKTKHYNLYLKAHETRLLFVELTGFQGGAAPAPAPKPQANTPQPKVEEKKEDGAKEPGKVTVYSKPPGVIIVDGSKSAEKTPGTVEVANGRHEVQVEYENGEVSEKKIVRVRDGSRIKLFFRQRTDAAQ